VAAGNIGSAQYIQYATIGDTTNTASRISGVAGEGEVVISESTRAALRLPVPLTQLPPTTVKGKAEPLTLFRVGTGDLSSPHRRTY
jgi:adenylate cyclase